LEIFLEHNLQYFLPWEAVEIRAEKFQKDFHFGLKLLLFLQFEMDEV